jgi:membrane protein DedA with SNARE-associated domain
LRLSTTRIGALIWVLIYGGLFAIALGVAMKRNGASYGELLFLGGAAATVVGAVLVWVRSRMAEPPPP